MKLIIILTLIPSFQRRDYSALTKYLPPKYEYIVYVRLSDVQCDLYRKYLDHIGITDMSADLQAKSRRQLFADQQTFYRIWTHPYALKLHEIRESNKVSVKKEYSV